MHCSIGQAAEILNVPARRLEGWVERGLLRPRIKRGRTPHRNRAQFGWPELMMAAIVAESQKLLGRHFRPGNMCRLITGLGDDRYAPEAGTTDRVLILRGIGWRPVQAVLVPERHATPFPDMALVIDLGLLARKLEKRIDRIRRSRT